jgi:hypothetical protein
MHKVKAKMLAAKAEWHPNAFVLDDADNEINSLKFESRTPPSPLWLPNLTRTSSKSPDPFLGGETPTRERDPFLGSETPFSGVRPLPQDRDPYSGARPLPQERDPYSGARPLPHG